MRQPAGLVWTELQQRRYGRLVNGATADDLAPLISLIDGLEREFPNEIADERELWGDALDRASAEFHARGEPAAGTPCATASDGAVHRPASADNAVSDAGGADRGD